MYKNDVPVYENVATLKIDDDVRLHSENCSKAIKGLDCSSGPLVRTVTNLPTQ